MKSRTSAQLGGQGRRLKGHLAEVKADEHARRAYPHALWLVACGRGAAHGPCNQRRRRRSPHFRDGTCEFAAGAGARAGAKRIGERVGVLRGHAHHDGVAVGSVRGVGAASLVRHCRAQQREGLSLTPDRGLVSPAARWLGVLGGKSGAGCRGRLRRGARALTRVCSPWRVGCRLASGS
jgi:hypothetical protein